ncbi:STIV orfB116 family protein [Vibrio spartinae]|uniref:DNA binding protein n=1 Tax=Vibrio spartinae TaxID=1918945 RepID=A0ABX6R3T5_9VIBR|nr:DUF1874 domain-containing protein [Vibrio spartinae]QMV15985.1 DNA binding protein [Vibrio spartinae]
MAVFLLNSSVLTTFGRYHYTGPLTVPEVKNKLSHGFVSAIGHENTAKFLTQLTGISIPYQRIAIEMAIGDQAVVFDLKTRLPQEDMMSLQLENVSFQFGLLVREDDGE